MNLTTEYLGLKLRSPFIVGASPFCDDTFVARRLQDAGAGAVVMRTLFAEQLEPPAQPYPLPELISGTEASIDYPDYAEYQLSVDAYVTQVWHLKSNLSIPVVASLGGARPGDWTVVACRLAEAGVDAIELNLYNVATNPDESGDEIESRMLQTVSDLKRLVKVPIAVKLSPFHTSLPQFAGALVNAGAAGLVLFNRFYQPDIDPDEMEVQPVLRLSDPQELLLRLRWLAILSPRRFCSLAAGGGVHTASDAIKALLAGADTIQVVSALLRHGPHYLGALREGLEVWMRRLGYSQLSDFRGLLNHGRCPDPAAFERANYIRILQRWRV